MMMMMMMFARFCVFIQLLYAGRAVHGDQQQDGFFESLSSGKPGGDISRLDMADAVASSKDVPLIAAFQDTVASMGSLTLKNKKKKASVPLRRFAQRSISSTSSRAWHSHHPLPQLRRHLQGAAEPDWTQVGHDINGQNDSEGFGYSLAMSADGRRIVVGNDIYGGGIVRVFERRNIVNGTYVAAGAEHNSDNGPCSGHVRIFEYPNDESSTEAPTPSPTVKPSHSPSSIPSFSPTEAPTPSPTVKPSHSPSSIPSLSPSASPSSSPTIKPSHSPSSAPSFSPSAPPTSTPLSAMVHCDFATLQVASFLSNAAQQQQILLDCGITSVTAESNSGDPRNVNVFNSSDIKGTHPKFDPDLGSPNRLCPSKGPGRGRGGRPNGPFPNCIPQGNLLIIQDNNNESTPNDAANGGCLYIMFQHAVNLVDMGLLDMEEPITITVIDSDTTSTTYTNPNNIGNNGFWPEFGGENIVEIQMCIPHSGALSYIDYFVVQRPHY